jgi:DNA-binding response OmpR family regulator
MHAIIVLADDETDVRTIYATCLRETGYEVWEASDGGEALMMVRKHRPSLLILDLWMPVLNGLEVLDQLRHDPLSGTMKVVMLSNIGDSDTRLEGFAVGVTDYWIKGLALNELRRRVQEVMDGIEVATDRAG